MMESSDPLSFPSEPPHIGNWFSSYAYESPVLSSIDGLDGDHGEGKISKDENLVKDKIFGRETCLSSGENAAPNEILRLSEYLELSYEPLDVNDSISSYVPETPMSDEDGDLGILESDKINYLKDNGNSRGFSCETTKEKGESFSKDIREGVTDGWISKGLVRCNTSVEALNCENQAIRSSDYLSSSPEPADINYCLDSYVPETQEFDENNDSKVQESNDNELNDHDGQRWVSSSLGKGEKDDKCTRIGMKEKSVPQFIEGLAKFNTSKENYKNLSQSLPSSDDITLSSEPLDIKNWFFSYAYESPTLDSSDGFSLSKKEESEFDIEEHSQRKPHNLGSTKAVFANDKNTYQPSPKKTHDSAENKNLFSQENTDFVTSLDGKSSAAEKLEKTFPEEGVLRLSNDNISLIQTQDSAEHNLVPSNDSMKTTDDVLLPRNSSNTSTVTGQSSQMETGGSISKENGFISTRKMRSVNDENCGVKGGCPRNERKYKALSCDYKDSGAKRVLLDTTNIIQQNQPGKWQCPQKRKPHLGPPLKQLRLEQWIRKV